jgi:molecular chaperone GrpE
MKPKNKNKKGSSEEELRVDNSGNEKNEELSGDLEKLDENLVSLKSEIEKLGDERDKIYAQLQRVSADYVNFQKRVSKQVSDAVRQEKERLIKMLLPAFDNFDHSFANADKCKSPDDILKAFGMIYKQFLDVLKQYDVKQIEAEGELFDPNVHEAIMQQKDEGKRDNEILQEFQKGYKLGGLVIRPSKVIVNRVETVSQGTDETEVDSGDEKQDKEQEQ